MATEYSIGVEQMVEQMVEKIPPEIDNKILDIDKEKESKEKENVANAPAPLKRFIKPSIEEIKAYCNERNNKVNGFFATTQDYDSNEVANALNAAGILSDNDVQKFGNNHEIIEIYS